MPPPPRPTCWPRRRQPARRRGPVALRVFLRSGEQASVDYAVPGDEQLSLLCHIPGHIEKGMVGRVDLRDISISA